MNSWKTSKIDPLLTVQILYLKKAGLDTSLVAELLGCSPKTVQHKYGFFYKAKRGRPGGIKGFGERCELTPKQKLQIRQLVKGGISVVKIARLLKTDINHVVKTILDYT